MVAIRFSGRKTYEWRTRSKQVIIAGVFKRGIADAHQARRVINIDNISEFERF